MIPLLILGTRLNLGQHFQVVLEKFAVIPLQLPKHFLVQPNQLAFRYCPSGTAFRSTVMFATDPYWRSLHIPMIECSATDAAIQQIGEQMWWAMVSAVLIRFLFQQSLSLFKNIPGDNGRMCIDIISLIAIFNNTAESTLTFEKK